MEMNELIKRLAVKAGMKSPDGFKLTVSHMTAFQLEKFAELIVRECAALAMTEHHSTSPADYDDMEPYEQGCDDTASNISGTIRRVFGVQE
jgi:hypothetical protein